MSITDELREWAHGFNGPWRRNEEMLLAIADRIDAEHERAVAAAHSNGITEYGSMVAHEYVKLPVDADGEVIHIGDVMWQKDRITKRACKAIMGDAYVMLDGIQGAVYANGLTHYHEPTVEDVLTKMLEQAVGYSDAHTTVAASTIVEYAAKLRLAGDAE